MLNVLILSLNVRTNVNLVNAIDANIHETTFRERKKKKTNNKWNTHNRIIGI